MERLHRMRQPSRTVVTTAILAMVAALFVTLGGYASASSTTTKAAKAAVTITVAKNAPGPEDHPLFTIGHAMVAGQCGGDSLSVTAKITITAVGGPIAITTPGAGLVLANAGDKDAIWVISSTADQPEWIQQVWSGSFAVFDEAGPSFSGTAGMWWVSKDGPCMFTAQVAG